MSAVVSAKAELADFLRTRRRHITPESVGIALSGQRRTPGLRREEVSVRSGVSLTWYTWLEQGRDIKPSRQVMDALARTLQMSPAEHEYVLRLTGHATEPALSQLTVRLPPHGSGCWMPWGSFRRTPSPITGRSSGGTVRTRTSIPT